MINDETTPPHVIRNVQVQLWTEVNFVIWPVLLQTGNHSRPWQHDCITWLRISRIITVENWNKISRCKLSFGKQTFTSTIIVRLLHLEHNIVPWHLQNKTNRSWHRRILRLRHRTLKYPRLSKIHVTIKQILLGSWKHFAQLESDLWIMKMVFY